MYMEMITTTPTENHQPNKPQTQNFRIISLCLIVYWVKSKQPTKLYPAKRLNNRYQIFPCQLSKLG